MAFQRVVSTPVKSPNNSPFKAPLPTALKGRRTLPAIQVRHVSVTKHLHGLSSFMSSGQANIKDVSLPEPDNYPLSANAMAAVTAAYTLYSGHTLTFTNTD